MCIKKNEKDVERLLRNMRLPYGTSLISVSSQHDGINATFRSSGGEFEGAGGYGGVEEVRDYCIAHKIHYTLRTCNETRVNFHSVEFDSLLEISATKQEIENMVKYFGHEN